jgi:methylated-DNA-[protein]-cysteine S-methyltransferase
MQFAAIIGSPVGKLGITTCHEQLTGIHFLPDDATLQPGLSDIAKETSLQLEQYFNNRRSGFALPMKTEGTPFQLSVWNQLDGIAFGQTKTYGAVANQLKTGPRAVGNACRRHPIPLIIPCHRVVAKTHLGGYSGARLGKWLAIKSWLLEHEQI